MLVVTSRPAQSNPVADLVKYRERETRPIELRIGRRRLPHQLLAEIFKNMTGIDMAHVPYKGSSPALNDVVGGHIQLLFSDPLPSLPQIKAGNVRALGVSTAARWPTAPEIPTIAESGVPGFDAAGWGMVIVPAGHPEGDRDPTSCRAEIIIGSPEIQEQILKLGMLPATNSSREELQPFINSEIERWGKIVRQVGLAGTQ